MVTKGGEAPGTNDRCPIGGLVSEEPSLCAGRRLLLSGREALTPQERAELRRLVNERTRERLGFGIGSSARLRELILALLAEEPRTCADIARTLRVSEARVRGALRSLQLQGETEVDVERGHCPSVWRQCIP